MDGEGSETYKIHCWGGNFDPLPSNVEELNFS